MIAVVCSDSIGDKAEAHFDDRKEKQSKLIFTDILCFLLPPHKWDLRCCSRCCLFWFWFGFDGHPSFMLGRMLYLSAVPCVYFVCRSLSWDCNFSHLDASYMQLHMFLLAPLLVTLLPYLAKVLIYFVWHTTRVSQNFYILLLVTLF